MSEVLTSDKLRSLERQNFTQPKRQKELENFSYTRAEQISFNSKKRDKKLIFKALPLFLIVAGFFAILIAMNAFNSPVATMARLATDLLNTQDTAVDARMLQLLNYKINNSPSDNLPYAILEEYRNIEPELKVHLKRNGIIINQEKKEVSFRGKTIYGDQFLSHVDSDIRLTKAVYDATAIRRAIFQDEVWQDFSEEYKLTQLGLDAKFSDKSLAEQELELTKSDDAGFRYKTTKKKDPEEETNHITQNLATLNQTADSLSASQQTPTKKSFTNLIFIEQPEETCSLYNTVKSTQDYQKTTQATQLSRLASLILTEADKIKADKADKEVVNYLNERLTSSQIYIGGDGQEHRQKSAMESYAQLYLANGYSYSEAPDTSAQKYIIGANQPLGLAIKTLDETADIEACKITKTTKKDKKKTAFFNFDFKQFFDNIWRFLTGAASPDYEVTKHLTPEVKTNTTATNLSAMTGLSTAPDLAGEDLANGFASGVAELMSKSAQNSGLSVLTKDQAVAYLERQETLIAKYAEIDRQTLSPFDTRSPYTLLGSISLKLGTTMAQTGLINKIFSFTASFNKALASFSKTTHASTSQQIRQNFEKCYDREYLEAHPEIALSPFCSPIYGIDPKVLDLSPEVVIDKLVASGNLVVPEDTCETGIGCYLQSDEQLKEFEENCVKRKTSIGTEGEENDNGASCVATDEITSLFSVYLLDQRINAILEK